MPTSRTQINLAGDRIRAAVRAGAAQALEDLALVEDFRAEYLQTVVAVQELLTSMEAIVRAQPQFAALLGRLVASGGEEAMFLSVASRPKTVSSIVAKLGRESTRLTQMQDIAGARIVLPLRDLQDGLLATIRDQSEAGGFPLVRVTDTREHGDDHGYRAVHAVLEVAGRPAEIQIRTPLEQAWAQLVEFLDSQYGWDLKHGRGPESIAGWLVELSDASRRVEAGEDVELPQAPDFRNTGKS